MPRWRRPLCACVKASANARDGGARVAVFLGERLGRLAIRRDAGGETEPHRCARDQPDPLAEAEDRVEHDAGRARQRASVERRRMVGVAAAAEESRAIGLPFDRPLRPAFEAQDVHRPHAPAPGIARAPVAEQRGAVGQVFGFEKQFAEGRMREIVGGSGQHDLGIAGDVDLADPRALVDHRHPADFDVVFGGHGDIELGGRSRRRGGGTSPARRGTRPGSRPAPRRSDDRWPTTPTRSARRAGRRTGCRDRASGRAATWSPRGRGRSCCRRRRWSRSSRSCRSTETAHAGTTVCGERNRRIGMAGGGATTRISSSGRG